MAELVSERPRRGMTRRRLLKVAGAGFVGAAVGGPLYAWRVEPHWVTITRRTMPVPHLPEAWIGKRLVQISDLHVGPVVDSDYLRRTMRKVAALRPDLLCITGDFMTCRGDEQVEPAAAIIKPLSDMAGRVVAVLGNHDYGSYRQRWHNWSIANALVDRIGPLGVRVLRNEVIDVDGLQIIGVDDLWADRAHPRQALAAYDARRAAVAMVHNPDAVDLPQWSGYRGWILSGHTHGGQVDPPFFDPPRLPIRNLRYASGAVDLADGRTLYVNRGLGYLRRVRFGVRPEITAFTLTRA
jgi:predicted MPP superfamily phosphohydrolase